MDFTCLDISHSFSGMNMSWDRQGSIGSTRSWTWPRRRSDSSILFRCFAGKSAMDRWVYCQTRLLCGIRVCYAWLWQGFSAKNGTIPAFRVHDKCGKGQDMPRHQRQVISTQTERTSEVCTEEIKISKNITHPEITCNKVMFSRTDGIIHAYLSWYIYIYISQKVKPLTYWSKFWVHASTSSYSPGNSK